MSPPQSSQAMAVINDHSGSEVGQAEAARLSGTTADPVIRTALLVRRMRALGAELRDVPGPKRDMIVKMWSHGAMTSAIARATELSETRIEHILGLRAAQPASSTREGASNGAAG